jgi:hypothetical protein
MHTQPLQVKDLHGPPCPSLTDLQHLTSASPADQPGRTPQTLGTGPRWGSHASSSTASRVGAKLR